MNHPASDTETLLQLKIFIYVTYAVHSISANVAASRARLHLSDAHLESLAAGRDRPGISGVGGPRTVTLTGEFRGPFNGLMYAVVLSLLRSPVHRQDRFPYSLAFSAHHGLLVMCSTPAV